ncbi:HECT-domain-containing protein [Basidiobolus meristosporus CBS 931.73]|uniref:HECT-type E3 ubiquitin transferase n=1 Tax=Basidiobolus meristosporus CBS 931.73 TaxID=1314790 RepID=A0A1Y1YI75_9FUNG|nr:HECT-domain-containing protein [Basidiobolus meristosporus CBS 931.73]|eukprot:ORX97741.1 HECT-domain-containing protein [Basidiobolus meristosporus CBS 931.73]
MVIENFKRSETDHSNCILEHPPTSTDAVSSPTSEYTSTEKAKSASFKQALCDPQLNQKLKKAVPKQWERDHSKDGHRAQYQKLVKRYYYQLTVGCDDSNCRNRFCSSCQASPHMSSESAAIFAVQLASRSRHYFCSSCPVEPEISLPNTLFTTSDTDTGAGVVKDEPEQSSTPKIEAKPFLFSLFSSAPFLSMFSTPSSKNGTNQLPRPPSGSPATILTSGQNSISNTPNQLDSSSISRRLRRQNIPSSGDGKITNNELSAPALLLRNTSTYSQEDTEESNESQGARKERNYLGFPKLLSHSYGGTSGQVTEEDDPSSDWRSILSNESDDIEPQLSLSYLTLPLLQRTVATYSSEQSDFSPVNKEPDDDWLELKGKEREMGEMLPRSPKSIMSYRHYRSLSRRNVVMGSIDSKFLINTIRTVFSSTETLNVSFLAESPEQEHMSGLDLDSIRNSYNLILHQKPKQLFIDTLAAATEIVLAELEINSKRLSKAEGLRVLLILLENPLMKDSFYSESLLRRLTQVLSQVSGSARSVLLQWFSTYDGHGFLDIVNMFHDYLANHFQPSPRPDDPVACATKVLGLLYDANETSRPEHLVPPSAFYNTVLSSTMNIKDEYRLWKKLIERDGKVTLGSSIRKPPKFSYFNYPFLFDPSAKSLIFHVDAVCQMSKKYEDACVHHALVLHAQRFMQDSQKATRIEESLRRLTCPYFVLEIRRDFFIEDTLTQIEAKARNLKKPLKIRFVNGGEEGIDQGGVQKEFFQMLVAKLLDPVFGMFVYDEKTRYSWINGASKEGEKYFELVGVILGLALYNGVIIGANFPKLIYKKILGKPVVLDDIKEGFPELGRGLEQMLEWEDGDVYDVFMREFEIAYDESGAMTTYPLIPDGSNIPVTNQNREEYVQLYIDHFANKYVSKQFSALRDGFLRVCGGTAISMLRPEELELLLCGNSEFNLDELERGAQYDDGYSPEHYVIRNFWSIVHELSHDQQKKLLIFVTASDRVPVKGLGTVTFVIQRNGPDSERLPTALTCFGRLLLPEYSNRQKLKKCLLTAIENARGFGLV